MLPLAAVGEDIHLAESRDFCAFDGALFKNFYIFFKDVERYLAKFTDKKDELGGSPLLTYRHYVGAIDKAPNAAKDGQPIIIYTRYRWKTDTRRKAERNRSGKQ